MTLDSSIKYPSEDPNFIDDFIVDKLADFDISQLYSHPKYRYSASYDELDEFRKNFFEKYNIKIDNNKFIRGHREFKERIRKDRLL